MTTRHHIIAALLPAFALACGGNGSPGGSDGSNQTSSGGGSTPSCTAVAEESPGEPVVEPMSQVTVSTVAGSGQKGSADGTGDAATFDNPVNLLADDGSLIVADFNNSLLRRVTPEGEVSTLSDPGAEFTRPFGLTWGPGGVLFVQTDQNTEGSFDKDAGSLWSVDGDGEATLELENVGRPRGLAKIAGAVAMADVNHHAIRRWDPATGEMNEWLGQWDCPGLADGQGAEARFESPYGMDRAPNGSVVVADRGNHAIRRIQPNGEVTTIAGTGSPGMVDGALGDARFANPIDVAVDSDGNIFVSDLGNQRIRMIDAANARVVTVAGSGERGFADGAGAEAAFYGQEGIEVTPDGMTIYVADGTQGDPGESYHRIRKIVRN